MRSPAYADDRATVLHGDCLEVLRELPANSVDALITDPPYGLEFMGKEWDRFRVDDPGTNRHRGEHAGRHGETDAARHRPERLKAFGSVAYGGGKRPTTSRCTGCDKRDQFRNDHPCADGAGWVLELIREDGAPPSMLAFGEWCRQWAVEARRVLKPGGYLLAFGGTRTWHRLACGVEDAGFELRDSLAWLYAQGMPKSMSVAKAIAKNPELAEHADTWAGWGTALKPCFEPVIIARKPFAGTVAATVLEHGTGAINVDACRIPHADAGDLAGSLAKNPGRADVVTSDVYGADRPQQSVNVDGRWPTNVALDEETAEQLGDAARYFPAFGFHAKASTRERPKVDGVAHPTVKPLDFMRWLVRLVVGGRPDAVVLEPFAGSGTTVEACLLEGVRCLAIEAAAEYLPLIGARIARATPARPDVVTVDVDDAGEPTALFELPAA